jgi:hypothetical protein
MNKENIDSIHDTDIVPEYLLKFSNTLNWEEKQLTEYIRNHPEEKEKLIELLKK